MSNVRRAVLAVVAGWGLVTLSASGNDPAPAPDDAPIKAVLAHFADNGIKMRKDDGNWWVVADPKGDGYEVIVAFRTFPANATEAQMWDELKPISLAFLLNAPARVAMSCAGLRSLDLVKRPPKLDQVPVVAKLEKLFKEYRPPEEPSVRQLQRDVAERERQLTRVQRELAEARARVALAEGKRELAIAEFQKAVACYQSDVQWIRYHANWFCDPREPMTEAQWDLAKARAWLADVEGDTAALVAQRKAIVGFHEERLQIVRRLEQLLAVKPAETSDAQKALDQARERLAAAEKRLAVEQARKPAKPK